MRFRRRTWAARGTVLALTALVATAPGCGGTEASDWDGPTVTVRVTREFGREVLLSEERAPLARRATVLKVLREHADVDTVSGDRYITAIDGVRAASEVDVLNRTAWALNVNGIEADVAPRDYRLHPGDVVQLDLRYWYVTLDVRATVGAFPQTFARGTFGRRFPVTLECADPRTTACRLVERRLRAAGVATDGSPPPGPRPPEGEVQRARVLVGPWKHWRDRPWPHRLDEGAPSSGVFARFTRTGDSMRLLNWYGRAARNAGDGAGLVGAMRPTKADLVWLVTGVEEEGVERAARALGSDDLRDAFALVVTGDEAENIPLPP